MQGGDEARGGPGGRVQELADLERRGGNPRCMPPEHGRKMQVVGECPLLPEVNQQLPGGEHAKGPQEGGREDTEVAKSAPDGHEIEGFDREETWRVPFDLCGWRWGLVGAPLGGSPRVGFPVLGSRCGAPFLGVGALPVRDNDGVVWGCIAMARGRKERDGGGEFNQPHCNPTPGAAAVIIVLAGRRDS